MTAKQAENKAKTKRPPTSGGFKSGRSGNPGGRPAKTEEEYNLEAACRTKSLDALEVIETLMRTADKDSVKLAAATFIIERAHGKAVQKAEVSGKDGGPIAHSLSVSFA